MSRAMHTVQDLAQVLDREQLSALDLAALALVAAQPAPEEQDLDL